MTLFVIHTALLLALSWAGCRSLCRSWIDRTLGALLLAWGNLIVTSLALSTVSQLGEPSWYFRTSLLTALLTWLLLRQLAPEPETERDPLDSPSDFRSTALFFAALAPVVWIALRIALTYEPNNYDSLTYHLPRAMFYLGQGNLAHFDTGNPRQIYFPLNYNLLQAFVLVYAPPRQYLNLLNLAVWAASGLAVWRLSRLCAVSVRTALLATWLTLTSTQILAQATATTNDLPTGAGLLAALVFLMRWRKSRLMRDAVLAGLAVGLAAGAKLTVIFFVPTAGLLIAGPALLAWRRGELRAYLFGLQSWIPAAMLALVLAAPFAVINLAEKGEWLNKTYDFTLNRPFSLACVAQTAKAYLVQLFIEPLHRFTFDLTLTQQLNEWSSAFFFPHWNANYAFSPLYLFPPDLNEDHVWFGFTGPAILLAGVFCLLRRRQGLPFWLGALGLGWFATYFLLNKWSLYNQRYFVPAILVLGPCLSVVLQAGLDRVSLSRFTRFLGASLAIASVWLAGIYLFANTSRPYAPLWEGKPAPPALPALPALMVQRLADQPRVNIDSTDGNERIFLLMTMGHNQRFTARDRTVPDAYNVYSEWGFVRKVAYSNIEQLSSYTIVDFPTKRTAGVEFLGTLGAGQPALDYYGLAPHPENLPGNGTNRHVLVNFYYGPREPNRYAKLRIKVAGLNLPDHARLKVGVDYTDGTSEVLATFKATGDAPVSVTRPFRRFTLRIEDEVDGRTLGKMELPYLEREGSADSEAPDDPISLFSDELVTASPRPHLLTEGLAAPEGPYPQWDLPMIRWAKSPILRLEIPAQKHLSRIEFSFELRLHARDSAQFDILFNGELIEACEWNTATGWYIRRYNLTPKPGANVIEIRNVSVESQPDWLGYLARYPDVKAYVLSQGVPLEKGAREHYEAFGKKEHRILHSKRHTVTIPGDQLYYLFRTLRVDGYRTP